MPPFISPESVKELNEVMCVTNDNWTPIPMYCSNCGAFAYKMRLEAMKRQAGRPSKENASPLATNKKEGF